jgi:hypothetical protein
MDWLGDAILYRRLPQTARLMMDSAAKVRASGLPTEAVPDKTLRAILEASSFEDDDDIREMWTNLLANAATVSAGEVHPSFPEILRQFDPLDAQVVDLLHKPVRSVKPPDAAQFGWPALWSAGDIAAFLGMPPDQIGRARLENLVRLGVCWYPPTDGPTWDDLKRNRLTQRDLIALSQFGLAFMTACQSPYPPTREHRG